METSPFRTMMLESGRNGERLTGLGLRRLRRGGDPGADAAPPPLLLHTELQRLLLSFSVAMPAATAQPE